MPSSRRDDLVSAAARVFARDGFHGVGIERVLAESGVAKMTLYRHFKSKDELIAAALEKASVEHIAGLESQLSGDGVERVMSLFDALASWCASSDFNGCVLLNAAAEFKDRDHPVRLVVRRHAERLRDLIRRIVAELGPGDADALTNQLMLLVQGVIEVAAISGCASCTDTAKRAARTLISASV